MHTPTSRFVALSLLTGLLVACSSPQTQAPATDADLPPGSPYAGGASHPWSDRLEAPVADPYAAGRDYPWASARAASGLGEQALRNGENDLSALQWTSATSGWGPIERNRSNGEQGAADGRTLTIGGQTFAKGLGVHSDSDVRYALNGQCSNFSATIGIDDEVGNRGNVQFEVYGDGIFLAGSQATGSDSARSIDVNVTGVKELSLRVLAGENPYYDHADWADASLYCTAAQPQGTVNLSDLVYRNATNGWGPLEFDRSNGEQGQFDGRPLTIAGQTHPRGLGVHAPSTVGYDLAGRCTSLAATVGLDAEVGARGSVVFRVIGDGRTLYDSGVLRGGASKGVSADLSGVQHLELVVTDAGDNKDFDHANWAGAVLTCNAPYSSSFTLAQSTASVFHKHTVSLPATFRNISGTVNLRLDVAAGRTTGLSLDTTTLTLGGGEETRNIVISAPGVSPDVLNNPDGLTAPYLLTVSQNGVELGRAPITITENLLTVRQAFEPSTVTLRPGVQAKVTLVVRVSPALNAPVPIAANPANDSAQDWLIPVGDTYGTGGEMRRDYVVRYGPPLNPPSRFLNFYALADNFAGYRLLGYWTANVDLTVVDGSNQPTGR